MKTEAIEHQIEVYRGYAATYQEGSSDRRDCTEAADQMESELTAIKTALTAKDSQTASLEEYVRDHVHSFIDSDAIDRLMPFDEWQDKAAPSPPTGKVLIDIEEVITIVQNNTPMEGCTGCLSNLFTKLRTLKEAR